MTVTYRRSVPGAVPLRQVSPGRGGDRPFTTGQSRGPSPYDRSVGGGVTVTYRRSVPGPSPYDRSVPGGGDRHLPQVSPGAVPLRQVSPGRG